MAIYMPDTPTGDSHHLDPMKMKTAKSLVSASPISQASTAPSTPFLRQFSGGSSVLPHFENLEDSASDDEASPVDTPMANCVGLRPLQSAIGRWAQRVVEAQEWLDEQQAKDYIVEGDPDLVKMTTGLAYRTEKCLESRDDTIDGPEWGATVRAVDAGDGWLKIPGVERYLPHKGYSVELMHLMEVEDTSGLDDTTTDEDVSSDTCTAACWGLRPLKSVLGKWAQRVVEAQEWLEEQQAEEYVVEGDPELIEMSDGLAYRTEKCLGSRHDTIEGPAWGTTVRAIDVGDGWLKIPGQSLYLPKKELHAALKSLLEVDDVDEFDDAANDEDVTQDDASMATCIGLLPLKSELGQWAQRVVEVQEWLEEQQADVHIVDADPELVEKTTGLAYRTEKCLESRDDTIDGPAWGTTIRAIDAGDGWLKIPGQTLYLPKEELHVTLKSLLIAEGAMPTCVGLRPLVSTLGQWAQRVVEAQEWLEDQQAQDYSVDGDPELIEMTSGLAFRTEKRLDSRDDTIDGPAWGSTIRAVNVGEGWLKIPGQTLYLPKKELTSALKYQAEQKNMGKRSIASRFYGIKMKKLRLKRTYAKKSKATSKVVRPINQPMVDASVPEDQGATSDESPALLPTVFDTLVDAVAPIFYPIVWVASKATGRS